MDTKGTVTRGAVTKDMVTDHHDTSAAAVGISRITIVAVGALGSSWCRVHHTETCIGHWEDADAPPAPARHVRLWFGPTGPCKANSCCCGCPPRPRATPFPEERSTLGVIYGVLLWADMHTATPPGALGRSVIFLALAYSTRRMKLPRTRTPPVGSQHAWDSRLGENRTARVQLKTKTKPKTKHKTSRHITENRIYNKELGIQQRGTMHRAGAKRDDFACTRQHGACCAAPITPGRV